MKFQSHLICQYSKKKTIFKFIVFSLIPVLIIMISCSGSKKCESQIDFNGKKYIGIGKSKLVAKRNSCNKYCLAEDAKCDAIYRIWLDSPLGKKAGHPKKVKALYRNKKLMDCVTIRCARKCQEKLNAAKLTYQVKCK